MTVTPSAECVHCTVPTDGGDVCQFCATYDGPPITDSSLTGPGRRRTPQVDVLLAGAHLQARQAAEDIEDAIEVWGDAAPLLAVVDVVTARAHLIAAQRLIDKAATRITSAEVTR
jgi:hypothetical protein